MSELVEVVEHEPKYGGFIRETINHHEGCSVRGQGRKCGCDPIVVCDFIQLADSPVIGKLCKCHDDCDYVMCVTCGCGDCKWPGACKGKCRECGAPARPSGLPNSEGLDLYDCYCSEECSKIAWDRGRADGTIVTMDEVTPEQLNQAFKNSGLELVGVGPRTPS